MVPPIISVESKMNVRWRGPTFLDLFFGVPFLSLKEMGWVGEDEVVDVWMRMWMEN